MAFLIGQHLDTRTSHKGDDQFGAANRWRRPYSANTVGFTTWNYSKQWKKISLTSCTYGNVRLAPLSLDQFAITIPVNETAKKKINSFTCIFNFVVDLRIGIKACALMIPLLGVTWLFGLLSPVQKAFAYIFTILNSTQVSFRLKLLNSINLDYSIYTALTKERTLYND